MATSGSPQVQSAPSLSFPQIPQQTYGVRAVSVKAVSNSAGAITYSVISGPATISGYNAIITGIGTVVVKATQTENGAYAAATATSSFNVVAKPVPTLAFPQIATQTFGVGAISVRTASNSGASITYSVLSGPATISGYNAVITGIGTVVVKASQAESGTFAATTATTTFNVVAKPVPTLAFPQISTQRLGVGAISVKATSNSGSPITYSIVSGPATISGYNAVITGIGTVAVKASQAESGTFAAATATTSFNVVAKPVPSLAFPQISTQTFGVGAISVKATSNSGSPITYSILSGPATISGYNAVITGIGTVAVKANQAESGTFAAATATTTFNVAAKPLIFAAISPQTYAAAPFTVLATSASQAPVSYSVVSGPATISGAAVTITGAGTIVLGATQAASGIYPSLTATTSVAVAPAAPALEFADIAAQTVGNAPFSVSASSQSNGSIAYSVVSGPATLSGTTVHVTGVGTVLLSASQAATANYTATTTTTSFGVAASNGSTSATVAARLLDQSSFGPTLATIAHVQSVGVDGYLQEQFNASPSTIRSITAAVPLPSCTSTALYDCVQSEWWKGVLYGPDQLRQRVAFALSEIFVVSSEGVDWMSLRQFQNKLVQDAFGNYQTLLKDVALSPAMGGYLNMLNSAAPSGGEIANENFAREMMQLFTTGTNLLNSDGSLQLDGNGAPMPVYTQSEVQAFAKAYTGWTYATANGGVPSAFPNKMPNYTAPMVAVESAHDTSSKTLLDSVVLPGGQTAEQDLDAAIANIFNHPNVGPFFCRQLIQHLVKSNPSPGYISRVAAVFANNGAGVRGDLQAVVRAILTDQEARAGDTAEQSDDGHQREPLLFITAVYRGLGMINSDAGGSFRPLSEDAYSLNEQPYTAPSVFDFFGADYVLPGTTTNAPEFGLENTAQVSHRLSLADSFVAGYGNSNVTVDLSATSPLGSLASNPATLVDTLSTLFLHGQMSDQMRSAIESAILPLTSNAQRTRVAVYLVITSPDFNVIH